MAVIIPSTLDEVKEHLNGLGKLVTAKEWERAAIVWAWVHRPGSGAHNRLNATSSIQKLTTTQFAKLGIIGLKSKESAGGQ